jgi:hypothetical protein
MKTRYIALILWRVVRAKLDIYGFIIITGSIPSSSSSIKVQGCSNIIFTLSLKQPKDWKAK